jgi:hypothetical protein
VLKHYAVLVDTRYGPAGFVLTGNCPLQVEDWISKTRRVGFVGCASFEEAVRRAGMMERGEPGAWGPSSSWSPPLALAAGGS